MESSEGQGNPVRGKAGKVNSKPMLIHISAHADTDQRVEGLCILVHTAAWI